MFGHTYTYSAESVFMRINRIGIYQSWFIRIEDCIISFFRSVDIPYYGLEIFPKYHEIIVELFGNIRIIVNETVLPEC